MKSSGLLLLALVVPGIVSGMMTSPKFDEQLSVLLADPHVGFPGIETKWGPQPDYQNRYLTRAIDEVLAMRPLPRRVIVLGDLALWFGFKQDYATVRPMLDRITAAGIDLYVTMGNHDHRDSARLYFPEAAAKSPVAGRFVSIVDLGTADLVLLDTLKENPAGEGSMNPTEGELDEDQRAWFRDFCSKRTRPFFVAAHHDAARLGVQAFLNALPLYCGWINGHGHVWQPEPRMRSWLSNELTFSVTLPSTGWSCDIGYATLRTERDRAVLSLVQYDFFFPAPVPSSVPRPPAWDQQIRDHQNRRQVFFFGQASSPAS